jgi:hypothetical protein
VSHDYHEDRTPMHGYEATREVAMAAFAKSWRRELELADVRSCINVSGLIGASCAPGHHGYQRACDLITGKA